MNSKNFFQYLTLLVIVLNFISCEKDNNSSGDCSDATKAFTFLPNHDTAEDYVTNNTYTAKIAFVDNKINIDGLGAIDSLGILVVKDAGNYHLTGALANSYVIINATITSTVRVTLDNVIIQSKIGPAIYVKGGKKVIFYLAAGSKNILSDTGSYTFDDAAASEPNACLFSKTDLTLTGSGDLTINAKFKDGIASKDGLIFNGGKFTINANDDGVRAKDYILFKQGELNITAVKDGIKTTGIIDEGRGYLRIDDGIVNISAGDDGMHVESDLTINGGNVTVAKAYEGIEAHKITLNGGNTTVESTNDGYNVTFGPAATGYETSLNINGGYHVVECSAGDVYDTNGILNITGGTIIGFGPVGRDGEVLDYECSYKITGGTVICVGGTPRADYESDNSSQNMLYANLGNSNIQAANTLLEIKNEAGKSLMAFQSPFKFQTIVFSSKEFVDGNYGLFLGGTGTGVNKGGILTGGTNSGSSKNQSFKVSSFLTKIGG